MIPRDTDQINLLFSEFKEDMSLTHINTLKWLKKDFWIVELHTCDITQNLRS